MMFDTKYFSGITGFLKGLSKDTAQANTTADDAVAVAGQAKKTAVSAKDAADALTKTQVYTVQVTTGTDGTALVDYSSLKLTAAPRITFMPQLAASDLPVMPDILGTPTKNSCTVRVRRLTSLLNLGLLTSYTGVANLKLDVYVRPPA